MSFKGLNPIIPTTDVLFKDLDKVFVSELGRLEIVQFLSELSGLGTC